MGGVRCRQPLTWYSIAGFGHLESKNNAIGDTRFLPYPLIPAHRDQEDRQDILLDHLTKSKKYLVLGLQCLCGTGEDSSLSEAEDHDSTFVGVSARKSCQLLKVGQSGIVSLFLTSSKLGFSAAAGHFLGMLALNPC